MYHFILPLLKKKGINKLLLEVITENVQAVNSYKKSGFRIERELFCYKGEVSTSSLNSNLNIKKLQDYNWNLIESFWDIYPTWQNSKNVINHLKYNNIPLGAYIENQLVGYLIYSPNNKRIQQIAVSKNFRQRRIASTLIDKVIETYGNTFSVINVNKSSKGINTILEKIGLEKDLEQLEMKLQLDGNYS